MAASGALLFKVEFCSLGVDTGSAVSAFASSRFDTLGSAASAFASFRFSDAPTLPPSSFKGEAASVSGVCQCSYDSPALGGPQQL